MTFLMVASALDMFPHIVAQLLDQKQILKKWKYLLKSGILQYKIIKVFRNFVKNDFALN